MGRTGAAQEPIRRLGMDGVMQTESEGHQPRRHPAASSGNDAGGNTSGVASAAGALEKVKKRTIWTRFVRRVLRRIGDVQWVGDLHRQRNPRRPDPNLKLDPSPLFTEDFVSEHCRMWSRELDGLRGQPAVRALEIGSFEGRSALWFLTELLTGPGSCLVCVDPFVIPGQELRFDHNLRGPIAEGKLIKLKGFSGSVLPGLDAESFDFIYVDGSHRAGDVLLDAVLSWKLLKPAGFLLFDDYLWQLERPVHERPALAIDLFLDLFANRYELMHRGRQVLIRKVRPPCAGAGIS